MAKGVAVLAIAVALAACGPVESLVMIGDAKVALEAAGVASAGELAPFEYTAATEYLHKAREEMHFAEYQTAIELAELAYKYAEEARLRALENPRRGRAVTTPPRRPKVD